MNFCLQVSKPRHVKMSMFPGSSMCVHLCCKQRHIPPLWGQLSALLTASFQCPTSVRCECRRGAGHRTSRAHLDSRTERKLSVLVEDVGALLCFVQGGIGANTLPTKHQAQLETQPLPTSICSQTTKWEIPETIPKPSLTRHSE